VFCFFTPQRSLHNSGNLSLRSNSVEKMCARRDDGGCFAAS
jgi:hypothetical protein